MQYGVMLNTVNLTGSLYLNIIIQSLMVLVAKYPALTVDIALLGRRWNILLPMITSGASLLFMLLVSEGNNVFLF